MEENINYKGYTIEIYQDENPQNPREEFDNTAKMICFHRRYNLGDKHDLRHQDYSSWVEMERAIIKKYKPAIIKQLFLLDHSGISISTNDYNDKWDSGRVGFVIMTRKSILDCYEVKKITAVVRKKAEELLDGEVQTYDQYLRGEVYGYVVKDVEGDIADSCSGYFGEPEKNGLLEDARSSIEHELKKERA